MKNRQMQMKRFSFFKTGRVLDNNIFLVHEFFLILIAMSVKKCLKKRTVTTNANLLSIHELRSRNSFRRSNRVVAFKSSW